MFRFFWIVFCFAVLLWAPSSMWADELQVAAFSCDITPPLGQPLIAGDLIRTIEQPLLGKGIVLQAGEERYVLCALDWCVLCNNPYRSLRTKIARAAAIPAGHVALHCVHQHTAPAIDFHPPKRDKNASAKTPAAQAPEEPQLDPLVFEQLGDRLAATVGEAVKHLEPFDTIGVGQAKVEQVASSRRIKDAEGKIPVRWSYCKDEAVRALPEGRIDPYVKTITFARGEKPVVRLHYYATHPQTRYRDGRASSDLPGDAREALERKEHVPQVYFTGCAGDITLGKYNDGTPESRAAMAARLLAGMEAAIAATQFAPAGTVSWYLRELKLPRRETPANARTEAYFSLDLIALHIGRAIMLHMPGEPLIEFQLYAQSLKPDEFVAVAGYGDGGPCYICPAAAFDEGGYEPSASAVKPESETLLKKAIADLLEAKTSSER